MERKPNTQYVANISYGKDSLAMLEAIKILRYPLDRIVTAEVWATDTIQADLPPMVEFKEYADEVIKERYGIEVEHFFATKPRERERESCSADCKLSYERQFYTARKYARNGNKSVQPIYGFPYKKGAWCNDRLKLKAISMSNEANIRGYILSDKRTKRGGQTINGFPISIRRGNWCTALKTDRIRNEMESVLHRRTQTRSNQEYMDSQSSEGIGVRAFSKNGFSNAAIVQGGKINTVHYIGIASDETKRIEKHKVKADVVMPLVDIGWDEAFCRKWCEENDLLSPIYKTSSRGGCWFCHNQGVDQLRLLRHDYPDLWALLMKWDLDSPVTFKSDGHTVHDFDRRFRLEDEGKIDSRERFRWQMIDDDYPFQQKLF